MMLKEIIKKIFRYLFFWTVNKGKFQAIGTQSIVISPLKLDECSSVIVGNKTAIAKGAWIMGNSKKKTTMKIGDNTQIGHFAHIVAKNSIIIENSVLIADRVFISDCTHNYCDIEKPIIDQGISILNPVVIGEGSWVGENVCIFGATVGKHCVIGANSVVMEDIPDYSIAVGSPARVVKQYNFDSKEWEKI